MNFLRLLPVIISFLLLAAHFMHAGQTYLIILMLLLPLALIPRKPWVPMIFQLVLLVGAIEWLRTLVVIAQTRMGFGEPWIRMVVILGAVVLFTALSSLVFRNTALRKRYSDGNNTN